MRTERGGAVSCGRLLGLEGEREGVSRGHSLAQAERYVRTGSGSGDEIFEHISHMYINTTQQHQVGDPGTETIKLYNEALSNDHEHSP